VVARLENFNVTFLTGLVQNFYFSVKCASRCPIELNIESLELFRDDPAKP